MPKKNKEAHTWNVWNNSSTGSDMPPCYTRGDGSAVITEGGGAPLCYDRGDGSAVILGWPCYTRGDGLAARGVPDPVLELFPKPKCGLLCFS